MEILDKQRDYLFVSYAGEDWTFAEWLTLKLTSEGYRVWCDRFKLLGGESYPHDIDEAIRGRTFRLLAVMSRHSNDKANPLKERTLALNLARERKEDFAIPLNLDGLPASEINWMMSDLTYVSFHQSWAEGLGQLLKKLNALGAPRPFTDGKHAASEWLTSKESIRCAPERLWTNVYPLKLPRNLLRLRFAQWLPGELLATWPHRREGETFWAFEPQDAHGVELRDSASIAWQDADSAPRVPAPDIVTILVKAYVRNFCLQRGLQQSPDRLYLYFPPGQPPTERQST